MYRPHQFWLLVSAFSIVLSISVVTAGQVLRSVSGQVTDVYDGDTVTVTDQDGTAWKVKLVGVDAPELSQTFGKKAKKELFELVMGHPVTVKFDRSDGASGIVGIVELESQRESLRAIFPININQYLIAEGFAWYDRSLKNDGSRDMKDVYSKLEADARERKKGLWAEKNPVPPWEFRGRSDKSEQRALPSAEMSENERIIANKTSGLYYLSYCPDYDKVPALEKVRFKTATEAQAAGFKLAKSCELK